MKGVLPFFIAVVFCASVTGQIPESLTYETVVRDTTGKVVENNQVSFIFTILKGSTSGAAVYSERQSAGTDRKGVVSVSIGNGTGKEGNFSAIQWNADIYFLKVQTDPAGGNSYSEMSVTQLLNVPYELNKKPSKKTAGLLKEDEFVKTRKYVGQFVDFRHTGPETFDGPNIIWIKTTMDKTFGKFSAYGKTCEFAVGDNLYIRRIYYSPGDVSGYWIYQIENDSSVFYRLSDFQYDRKVASESLF
jgi:hypothetical protein